MRPRRILRIELERLGDYNRRPGYEVPHVVMCILTSDEASARSSTTHTSPVSPVAPHCCCRALSTTCFPTCTSSAAKARVDNAAGIRHAHISVGDTGLRAYQQGLQVLGTPFGTDEFIAAQRHTLSAQHCVFSSFSQPSASHAPLRPRARPAVPPRCARPRSRRMLERRGRPVRATPLPLPSTVRTASSTAA